MYVLLSVMSQNCGNNLVDGKKWARSGGEFIIVFIQV